MNVIRHSLPANDLAFRNQRNGLTEPEKNFATIYTQPSLPANKVGGCHTYRFLSKGKNDVGYLHQWCM